MHTASQPVSTASTSQQVPSQNATLVAQEFVRLTPDRLSALSDIALQAYICGCAERFLAAHRRWEQTSCFDAVGERDAWWHAESDALIERGTRPDVVARMEQERGLA